ncbi:carbon-phosphorus lyase complex subunit PhnI [Pseudomonas aeruginosa]
MRNDGSRRPTRTCRAGNCSVRPSTIPIACSTSACSPRATTPAPKWSGRVPGALSARARPARPGRPDDAGSTSRPARCRISPASRLDFPTGRAQRLQALARGDEGFLLALAYSTQRGYGRNHPFAGEIRIGACEVWKWSRRNSASRWKSEIEVTECEMVNQFVAPQRGAAALHPRLRSDLRL